MQRVETKVKPHRNYCYGISLKVSEESVLGPHMFLIYINDFAKLLASFNITIKLSADDVKLYVKSRRPSR